MSEFQAINISEEEISVVNKKNKNKNKKVRLIIEDEGEGLFIKQIFRKDILVNMLANTNLAGKELFDLIMKENNELCDERRQGWIFETLCQILISLKCYENINYTEIYDGQLQALKQITNINSLLKVKVDGGGNNIVDMTIKQGTTSILLTIKYKNKFGETDVSKIDNTITTQNIITDYKLGLIVKDKSVFINHKYKNKLNIDKHLHDKIIENGLLFDEKDVIKSLDVFCQRFSGNILSINDFIDFINAEYLLSPRQLLTKKLHQQMTELKFTKSFSTNKNKMWCIAHKPRSGKSILMLSICKYLLEQGYKKILIMTAVPATINNFVKDLDMWVDFKNINYKLQDEFDTIDETFNGIVFCSVQYLKADGKSKKKDILKKIGFDAIITDEAHQGSSTDKTKTEILEVDGDVEELRKNIKIKIFASGTADKTKKYYGIHNSCIYEWEIEDEAFMKELIKPIVKNREDIIKYMVNRHGNTFTECFENEILDKDYSKHPTQVLMKHSIPQALINEINAYNTKYGTNFGYNWGSLFALKQIINEKGEVEYAMEFELCKTTDGIDILKELFDYIISTQRMRNTIMKQIENTQTSRGSRKSTIQNPLLFIVYLPTHTRNNTISLLQKTLKQFLETHDLWGDYNIEFSNSSDNSNNINEKEYNKEIEDYMIKTKSENKKGCILLLGNKGSVGITYKDCDVTISLDDGHNLDNQKQRFSRALTEMEGKTIGINVDMNIQRTYLYLIDIIQKHRRNTKTTKTNAEILYYLFEHNVFLFDPQQINNGKLTTIEIMSYYQKEAENMMKEIDDTPFLENLICDDDMREFIRTDFQKGQLKKFNEDLEGEQQDCPKGDKTKVKIDAPYDIGNKKEDVTKLNEVETAKIELLINQTYEMCKSFLFPLLALISMSYKLFDFKEIFTSEKTKNLMISLLKDKKIELNNDNYSIIINIMNNIIDNNVEIVNNIREIYSIAPANKLRELIEKHFIPTIDEKKKYAEVPTPIKLVDEMLNTISEEFWKTPKKVFEPCCGKGNFVLGIFDKFYKGLKEMYPDEIERCRVIMTECIYYADLTALNVFITTEIMKCHVQSYCGLDELDYEFNFHTGNTLELNIEDKWHITNFDAVIGNPPYQDANATGDNKLYLEFIKYSLSILKKNGYLLFVTPTNIKNYITNKDKNRKYIDNFYEILYLSLNTANRHFKGISTYFAYFLIKNNIVTSCKTKVEFLRNKQIETDEITICEKQELPLCLSNIDFNILNKCSNIISKLHTTFDIKKATYNINNKQTLQRIRTTHIVNGDISRENVDSYKYPIIDKINKSTPFPGDVYYNKHLMNEHGIPKVVMCTGGYLMPSHDELGQYNLSDNMIYLLCDTKEKYNGFVTLINSKLIKYLNLITMTDNIHGRDVVIQNMKEISLVGITSDETIYKLYNLSENEIELIHKTITK
uniref:site-specific DNA-methyltransferase (adenine-specific) n=1 Tax=viral metagenome TaxID=1070528 RepID=A0A6C0EUV3_9ZZZZ